MASAKAIDRIDCTRIFVAAPGLRPTALDAAIPIRPTLRAAPTAARPTWMLPPRRLPPASFPDNTANSDIFTQPFLTVLLVLHENTLRPAEFTFPFQAVSSMTHPRSDKLIA